MTDTIIHTANQFDKISLPEMDSVSLMNRRDTKFIFRKDQLPELLQRLSSEYRMLETEGTRLTLYRNIYFDTADLFMYRAHHNGKLNRYKIRHREYADSGVAFFEIKFKSNKKRTVKERIRLDGLLMELNPVQKSLIRSHTPFDPEQLSESALIDFQRLTLVNNNFTDRCTLDINLNVAHGNSEHTFPSMVICEVKQERFSRNNFLIRQLEDLGIRPMRISKYCLSVLYNYPGVKYNRFKVKLRRIDQLENTVHVI